MVLKQQFFYGIQPAFIMFLKALKLGEQLVMNKHAKFVAQSMTKEQAQQQ